MSGIASVVWVRLGTAFFPQPQGGQKYFTNNNNKILNHVNEIRDSDSGAGPLPKPALNCPFLFPFSWMQT